MAFLNRRPHRYRAHAGKLHPLAIVAIVLGCTLIVTVIVGNVLNVVLDDETYQKLTQGEEPTPPTTDIKPSAVRNVNAYPYRLGDKIDGMIGQTSASVRINNAAGELQYRSDVGDRYKLPVANDKPLFETMGELCYFVPYVSGVFYPQAFREQNADLRYAAMHEETALLHEFLNAGGSELLICGWNPFEQSVDDAITYLRLLKSTAEATPIGIAIPYEYAVDTANWEAVARLSEAADFCALDLTSVTLENDADEFGTSPAAQALLKKCEFLLTQYAMRPLFAASQTGLISTAINEFRPTFQVIDGT